MRTCWLFRGIGFPLPRDVSPFSGGWEFSFQKMVTFYRGMGTSLSMVTPLPREGMPFATGGEPFIRAMGTPLPKDGTAFPKDGKPFSEGVGTSLPTFYQSVTKLRRGYYQNVTKVLRKCYQRQPGMLPKCYQLPEGCGPLYRPWENALTNNGDPFTERWNPLYRKMGTP